MRRLWWMCLLVAVGSALFVATAPRPTPPAPERIVRARVVTQGSPRVGRARTDASPAGSAAADAPLPAPVTDLGPDATAPAVGLRVRVLGPDGAPIPDASVTVLLEAATLAEAASDAEGWAGARIPTGVGAGLRVVASHPGYAARSRTVEPGPDGATPDVEVVLRPSAALAGFVRRSDGEPFVGCHVLAWPVRDGRPRSTIPPPGRAGAGGTHGGTTDGTGAFLLGDLESGSPHDVTIEEPGWVSRISTPAGGVAIPGSSPVTLTAFPVYVVDLRVFDAAGVEPVVSNDLVCVPGSGWSEFPDSALPIGRAAAAVPATAWPDRASHRVFAVCASALDVPRLGPFRGTIRVPGFRPRDVEAWAYRCVDGSWQVQEVNLERATAGVGDLDLEWDGEATDGRAAVQPLQDEPPRASLTLRPAGASEGGASPTLSVRLWSFGRVRLQGVPEGTYHVSVGVPLGPSRRIRAVTRDLLVTVSPGQTSLLRVPGFEAGRIDATVDLADVAGVERYSGRLTVHVWDRESGAAGQWEFDRAPYRIAGIGPGPYRIQVRAPGLPPSRPEDVVVVTDRTSTPSLALGRQP